MDDSPVFEKEVVMVLILHFLDTNLVAMLVFHTIMDSDKASIGWRKTAPASHGLHALSPISCTPARLTGRTET